MFWLRQAKDLQQINPQMQQFISSNKKSIVAIYSLGQVALLIMVFQGHTSTPQGLVLVCIHLLKEKQLWNRYTHFLKELALKQFTAPPLTFCWLELVLSPPQAGIERAWLGGHFPAPAVILLRWGTNFYGQLAVFITTSKRHTGVDLVPKTEKDRQRYYLQ